ncbi:Peroxiredoxin [Flavobacterium segetis]|uniref:Peroxiredoxin n=1 Tax=Flavobacterium segetis TaxID=271157 RepID=A0A1M5I5W7_9FLAO|nr:TlpA disulfide reductase family protein [Flavobacterium segetis]SHG23582.1 Peroxiredoxin [Flavobacterium segetis]
MYIRTKLIVFLLVAFSVTSFAQIKIGNTIPSIELQSNKDKKVNINEFKGKYVLIDFWASWCGPCRVGNKKLVQMHKDLDSSKIEIIGISIDTDAAKWKKAIEKDKINFLQLIDPKGFDANAAVVFGVEELPSKFLFDSEGILIMKNPTDQEIINLINK